MSDKQGTPILPPLSRGASNNGGASNGGAPQQTVSLQQVLATAQGLNVLATGSGQQFVITTQVPGLTQVIPNNSSTNANAQQVGVTRIVNIANTQSRNAATTVGGAMSAGVNVVSASLPHPSTGRQNSTKVVLATSPKLVRTSIGNVFVAPMSSSQTSSASSSSSQAALSSLSSSPQLVPSSSPVRKRLKLSESSEKPITLTGEDLGGLRRRVLEHKMRRMQMLREKYVENVAELFFLQAGGNMMDYLTWRKRPPTSQYLHFLRQRRLDSEDDDEDLTVPLPSIPELSQISSSANTTAVTATVTTPTTTTTTVTATTVAAAAAAAAAVAAATTTTVTSTIPVVTTAATSIPTVVPTPSQSAPEVKISGVGVTPVAVSTTLPAAVAQLSQHGQIPGRPQGGRHGMVFAFRAIHQSSPVTVHSSSSASATLAPTLIIGGTPVVADPSKPVTTVTTASPVIDKSSTTVVATATPKTPATITTLSNPQPIVKLVKLSTSTAVTTSCDITNNQEQIVEKAKQEAYVMQRIAELQREGLWSERRLPKVQEPARTKAHWDYLLEEMVWLAADFAQERKWKKAAAKKCARMVQKYFQEKAIQAQKAEKSQELRLKKIASFVAKEIKTFWTNVEKLVEYKQQTRLEEKRKKALDQHLNFIVGQTEKYSTWLTEGLNKTDGPQSIPASMNSSRISSPVPQGKGHSDEEFQPNQSSDDDEETIAKAEEEMKLTTNHKEEVELLKRESEIPLEDLLRELGGDYLEDRNKSLSPQDAMNETERNENEETTDGDVDFIAVSGESSDEEDTIMEEERLEGDVDHRRELDELKADNEMSIDELAAKYANMSEELMDVDVEIEGTDKESSDKEAARDNEEQSSSSESECEESDDESGDETAQAQSDAEETDVGLRSLLEDPSGEQQLENKTVEADRSDARNEMDNVAALAESIQPKGNTLLTTSVVTKIPFLLKHPLREYQHIGLDWLVTMYDRKLNGILADEMGLGKTIQTIALLAHLACEKGNWGPHLVIVPTSVMLNWEMECKKWCPGFKILTYYGTQKERKQKRTGWTKPNAFHICITSYKLVIQDHQSFRRKKWKYLILDEAQNIKNFKSQRWQLLLNFQTQRRLLLTGTPLQNNLMELWSLMHFLMPNVFQSHREFKEWFSNPVTGMIEGNSEYNENIIRRLHKVLRPFLLRRLKTEVEKQLPKKYEHVVMCRLSKRQRFLYDDFMSRAKTRETLASGNLLSVINVLMQLRKVCNHPNLFEVRPTVSPFQMEALEFVTASLVWATLDYDPLKHIDLSSVNLLLLDLELTLSAFVAHRVRRLQTSRKLIEEIDNQPEAAPRCPSGRIKINVRLSNQTKPSPSNVQQQQHTQTKLKNLAGVLPTPRVGTSPFIKSLNASQAASGQGVTLRVAGGQQLQGYSVQLVQHQGSVKAIPVATLAHNPQSTTTVTSTTATTNAQRITVGNANIRDGLQRLTAQTVTVKQGDSVQRIAMPSFAQLVQTSTGRHIILTSNQQNTNAVSFPVMTPSGQRLTVLSKSLMGLSSSGTAVNKVVGSVVTTTSGRPVMRVPPLNVSHASQTQSSSGNSSQQPQPIRSIVTRQSQKEANKAQSKEQPKSEFHLPQLEEERRQRRQAKLRLIANINERRCAACPLYGEDLFMALRIGKPSTACPWHNGWMHCATVKQSTRMRREFFSRTEALAEAIKSTERIVEELKEVFERFVVHVPAVRAPVPRFHVSHPPPHKLWNERRLRVELQHQLSPKFALLHSISGRMLTQFPDPRLIQYDCGKLQSLDRLLRKLKSDNHRVLIFTQMTRMLDVLEAFLNFHGHIYLRLDGTTRVDQRQVLMERFNGDKRIFCFILSTRSGGVGVNLTGADTVIFYDSDWNPTMDAQAQDRCHRIGQTRDVHIYRLVSEKTVEENILKKANQKRLLGDLAIEGGNFTTAYFKSSTIQDLFNIDQTENDPSARMAEVLEQSRDRERAWSKDTTPFQGASSSSSQYTEEKVAIGALESALAAAEEDLDVQAAKTAKAEAVADLAEFDENIPLDDADRDDAQVSKAEQEVQHLVSQLTPIERYAMRFIEESEGSFSTAQLAAAERELEEQKKEWELDRLRALREEEERRMRLAEDDEEKPLTFGREDAQNQVNSTAANKGGSKRLVNKRLSVPSRRSSRRRGGGGGRSRNNASNRGGGVRESSSRSENETTTSTESESESESQEEEEDVVEDSLDEESSHTESQSQGDEGEGEEEGDKDDDEGEEEDASEGNEDNRANSNGGNGTERGEGLPRRRGRLAGATCGRNHFDLNSPRTRSRGNVKINLWTLDVSPILPGVKPNCRRQQPQRTSKFRCVKFERTLSSSLTSSPVVITKRRTRINANAKASANSNENLKIKTAEEEREPSKDERDSRRNDRESSSKADRDSTRNERDSLSKDDRGSMKNERDSLSTDDHDSPRNDRDSSPKIDHDSTNNDHASSKDDSVATEDRNSMKREQDSSKDDDNSVNDHSKDSTKHDRGSSRSDHDSTNDDRGSTKNDEVSSKDEQGPLKDDRDSMTSSNSVKQHVSDADVDAERLADDHTDPMTPTAPAKPDQAKTAESKLDNTEQGVKEEKEREKNSDKVIRVNLVSTVCSVQVTRCSQKFTSATYRKLGPEVNRNEDAENLDVNVNTRGSLSSSGSAQSDVSLKRAKETTTATTREAKSVAEIVVSANSLFNNSRVKLVNAVASKESERNSVDSSASRSVPLLRSKTLRSGSPDISSSSSSPSSPSSSSLSSSNDKFVKSAAVSRVSVAQKNSKSDNVSLSDEDDARHVDEGSHDNIEPVTTVATRKYTSQKFNNSKSENTDSEKAGDSLLNSVSSDCSVVLSPGKCEVISGDSKYKLRKVVIDAASAGPRGVTTRSSKLSPVAVGSNSRPEESNVRLADDKVEAEATKNASPQVKVSQCTRSTSSSSSSSPQQQSVTEQSRVTRSTIGRSFTPPLIGDARNSPLRVTAVKRRPDTPLPRPITRSAATIVSFDDSITAASSSSAYRGEKHATRQNSKLSSCQDNGFVNPPLPFRRSRSIPPMKPDVSKETTTAVVIVERNPNIQLKRRPDTPRPTSVPTSNNEQQQSVPRVTRSGMTLNSATKAATSPPCPSNTPRTSGKQQQQQPPRGSPTREPSANDATERGSMTPYSFEKPQRTAKVVAILTLDTRSNHQHHNSKAPSSIQPKAAVNCAAGSSEVKAQDKEVFTTRLSDSLKEQETESEGYDSSPDSKSKRLRRENKRGKVASYIDEDGQLDRDDEPPSKRITSRTSSHLSAATSASTSSTQAQTRSEKLRNATVS
ncbi:helicase domino isoform X1 [Harpegnathos saltator]|uniref:helicase domino isoform X1 n=1 Tax=Harpegnathos saltator TaxID=610380 RepID=UPI000DBEDAA6|nr:helicase domino isoform X1 [Harpegnathos saltator]XP_025163306.1 helicase domino isoform X1 [Harpegnathos saltator]XP_025163307.1 helicase domino isoform X1 [Harpegnathos saltator]XP_025163308.1 helicase domino isoform X1 [Harpegnathos saltator]